MKRARLAALAVAMLLAAWTLPTAAFALSPAVSATTEAVATFAGGCFWCMESPFEKLPGVKDVRSGYIGGHLENPSYKDVSSGRSGHAEAVQIVYDPTQIGYDKLLYVFWRNVDPLTANRQFCDSGPQYRSAIFVHNPAQRQAARASRDALAASGRFAKPIVTEIVDATTFYPAEDDHQDYYKKNPLRYAYYRTGCGRDARLQEVWGDEAGGGKDAGDHP